MDFLSAHIGRIAAGLVIAILIIAHYRRTFIDRRTSIDKKAPEGPKLWAWNFALAVFVLLWGFVIVMVVVHGFFASSPVAEQPVVHPPFCFIYGFPEPSSPDRAPDLLKESKLPDEPAGCLRDIASHIGEATQVTLLGRTDRRELSPEATREYRSNDALALQRAKDMQAWLAPKDGADLLTAGPRYLGGGKTDTRLLERDRSVEIRAHWNNSSANALESRPKAGGLLNAASIGPDVSMALLALMVALSAYLATVSIFLADRSKKLETDGKTKEANEIKLQRRLLILADTPTVVAAFLLSLNVFAFYPSVTLVPASILLFRISIVTLILFHLSQWITALPQKMRTFLRLK